MTKPTATVAVASVTYNRCGPLLRLLSQLRELDYPRELLSVFLVDNASTDDTATRVRAEFPEVQLVVNPVNTGVSGGFNRSVQEALAAARRHKYVWLLDSDAEVEPETLSPLVAALEQDERIGVAGSTVYDPRNRKRLVTAGLRVDWKRGDIPLFVPDNGAGDDVLLDVDLIPACSLLTRSDICRRLGPWDARFPLYWGDTDWCARVLRDGHRVCCHRKSRVWHRDWASVQRGFGAPDFIRDHLRGALLFHLRYSPKGASGGVRHLLLRSYLNAALEHLTLRHDFSRAYIEAVDDVLRGSFLDRDFARTEQSLRPALETLIDSLAPRLGSRPRVLLNQMGDQALVSRVRDAFERRLGVIRWEEIPRKEPSRKGWSEYRCLRPELVPEVMRRLPAALLRPDVNVCDVSNPLLYNFVAARYAILLDASGRGRVEEGRITRGIADLLKTGLRGLKATYFDVPRALRRCAALREAVGGVEGPRGGDGPRRD
jgi:hypothetical protein